MTAQYKLTAEFEGTQFFYTTENEGAEYEHKNEKGEYHRLDGPAFVTKDGCEFWYVDGKKHREDGPASIYKNGSWGQTMMTWYKDGKKHREDGPAYIIVSLNKELKDVYGISYEWYLEGEQHRVDGPASEYVNGDKRWFVNDKLHREDGPAVEKRNKKKWYKHGKLHRLDGPAYELVGLTKIYKWYKDGKLHREDGPAYEFDDTEEQYMNALEFPQGYEQPTKKYEWWINGKRHRDNDEPAIIDGEKLFWYKNDLLHRDDDLPAVINNFCVEWFFEGERHREYGLPAVCDDEFGKYEWWVNGSLHREDGPAIIEGEREEFYLEDVEYPRNQFILLIEHRNEEVKNALMENTNICKDMCGIIADYVWSLDL